ncbi:DUF2892 domain-containing protein [Marivirga sp. S37H4]|uniref:DUF2892 domain-containing protein n=1 Tax=Marivirga aurantiaca TaxID=2802615 RepID=A0A934WWR9_9BACT|nr:SRPBCC family protein [Marivirga aurantiaca]MBK6264362.1 DUF2892 domain-containing protein [Marivirga aurantiaca]
MDSFNSTLSKLLNSSGIAVSNNKSAHINVGTIDRILSAAGGAFLTWYGIKQKSVAGVALALAGASLLYRGITAHSRLNEYLGINTAKKEADSIVLQSSSTIDKPRKELYAYWRKLENLPKFMKHLEEVTQTNQMQSHWKAAFPAHVEWDAQIIEEKENQFIIWGSLPGSEIDNAGEVRFHDDPEGNGTVVRTTISYRAPEGKLGANIAKMLNPVFKQMVEDDLDRFKEIMERGKSSSKKENLKA